VTLKRLEHGARCHIPEFQRAVIVTRERPPAIWQRRNGGDY
jgi:hypothetical protein